MATTKNIKVKHVITASTYIITHIDHLLQKLKKNIPALPTSSFKHIYEITYTQEHLFLLEQQFEVKLLYHASLDFPPGTSQMPKFFEEFLLSYPDDQHPTLPAQS